MKTLADTKGHRATLSKGTPQVRWNEKKKRWMAWVRFPDGSRPKVERVDRADAEADLNELLAVRAGNLPAKSNEPKLTTFADICSAWIAAGCPNVVNRDSSGKVRSRHSKVKDENTVEQAITCLAHVTDRIGALWVDRTGTERVERIFVEMDKPGARKDGKPGPLATSTIYRVWKHLDSALVWGIKVHKIKTNPAADALLPESREAAERKSFTIEQAAVMFKHIVFDRLGPLWLTMFMCGLRPGEIVGLRWCHVDLDSDEPAIAIEEQAKEIRHRYVGQIPPKKDSFRTIGLHPLAVAALLTHRDELIELGMYQLNDTPFAPSGFVFPTASGGPHSKSNLRKYMRRLTTAAGLGPDWTPYEFRHSFVSLADDALGNLRSVADVVGHVDTRTTLGYRHKVRPVIKHAVEAWNNLLTPPSEVN